MFILRNEEEISCSHFLPLHKGKCATGHGHNWQIYSEIHSSEINHNHMIVDFGDLKKVVKEWDHKSLNDFMENPTAECMAFKLAGKIRELVPDAKKIKVRVTESKGCSVEYIS